MVLARQNKRTVMLQLYSEEPGIPPQAAELKESACTYTHARTLDVGRVLLSVTQERDNG